MGRLLRQRLWRWKTALRFGNHHLLFDRPRIFNPGGRVLGFARSSSKRLLHFKLRDKRLVSASFGNRLPLLGWQQRTGRLFIRQRHLHYLWEYRNSDRHVFGRPHKGLRHLRKIGVYLTWSNKWDKRDRKRHSEEPSRGHRCGFRRCLLPRVGDFAFLMQHPRIPLERDIPLQIALQRLYKLRFHIRFKGSRRDFGDYLHRRGFGFRLEFVLFPRRDDGHSRHFRESQSSPRSLGCG